MVLSGSSDVARYHDPTIRQVLTICSNMVQPEHLRTLCVEQEVISDMLVRMFQ